MWQQIVKIPRFLVKNSYATLAVDRPKFLVIRYGV